MEDTLEFVYDDEAKAVERLGEKIGKEEKDQFLEIMYSSDNGNKKMAWGMLFGMPIDKKLRDEVIAELFAVCDPVVHMKPMFETYQAVKEELEKK